MKKYIEIPFEVVERLVEGKCVEGSLRRDQFTGKIVHHKDKLVKKLPWGWVKESMERIKVFGSFPKDMGMAHVMALLDEHNHDAKDALIDREIINIV